MKYILLRDFDDGYSVFKKGTIFEYHEGAGVYVNTNDPDNDDEISVNVNGVIGRNPEIFQRYNDKLNKVDPIISFDGPIEQSISVIFNKLNEVIKIINNLE